MHDPSALETARTDPILIVPYMWIGDFVRCHSVVRVLKERWPNRPVDFLTSTLCAPILDYLPGVRKGIVWDLPRRRLPFGQYWGLAQALRAEQYGTALVMLRTWKSALAPFLAGIPQRTGFVGEARFGLINDLRWGERNLERMIDCCGALALPRDAALPPDWPVPNLVVPDRELADWLTRNGLDKEARPIVAFAPGAVGPGKAWPPEHYAALARRLAQTGASIWVLGGPNERPLARQIAAEGGPAVRDLTGTDLRNAILALKAADVAVTNDSGLMHISAGLGTPTVAIFGPTSPRLWGPLNPLAAVLEPPGEIPPDIKQRRTADVSVERVFEAVQAAIPR
ncbi:MAG: lipopolysaccharide heptosyltransferase II [Pseudorhodoplanes sp.]|nr:lipopolysaccharide heptosyltransferase II [Pseudorhodoplanes sp.]